MDMLNDWRGRDTGDAEFNRKLAERNLGHLRYFSGILLALMVFHYLLYIVHFRGRLLQSGFVLQSAVLVVCGAAAAVCAWMLRQRPKRGAARTQRAELAVGLLTGVGFFWGISSYIFMPAWWSVPVFYCIVLVFSSMLCFFRFWRLAALLAGGEALLAVCLLAGGRAGDFWGAFAPTLAAALTALEIARLRYRGFWRVHRYETALTRRIARLKSENRRLKVVSETDALTKVFNRKKFDEYAALTWRTAQMERQAFSMFMIDIDLFKNYNDFYGHVRGDYCLVHIAQFIRHTCAPGGLTFRYGGEEFAVLLPGVDNERAVLLAERVRAGLEALQMPNAGIGSVVTVSIGVASICPTRDDNLSVFIDNADKVLYIAKQQGRNRVINEPEFYSCGNVPS